LADVLEALLGAVVLDGGFGAAEQVIGTLFDARIQSIDPNSEHKDPKTLLQELLQGRHIPLPKYAVIETSGEAHEQIFRVECCVPELRLRSEGAGSSRRSAEQRAAAEAYRRLVHGT
jgi:ribonuclease-3